MSHEEPHVARRSASQGCLSGSYAMSAHTNATIPNGAHHPVPYFKPLRSIREHGHTFLDPAASADGMLRKTTETGNIGLFSIKTGRPTALRPRASLGELRQPHRPFSRSSDRPPRHDDRKRLPSYRDSTSEIISMYGSENPSSSKSVSGTLSPPWDDSGQRSYSMTTCGSKSYTLPRNNDFRLPLDCHPGAQRPRSPYPYPTRLPRPGIRPSSPALTENGNVDYSRMVEIDRIPQATNLQVPDREPPIFYDYSENFEDAVGPPPELPIANPTPTRISKSFCPGIPDDDCDVRPESAGEEVGHIVDYLRRVTLIESADKQDRYDEGYRSEHDRSVSEPCQRQSPAQASCVKIAEEALDSSPVLPQSGKAPGRSEHSTATAEDHEDAIGESKVCSPDQAAESIKNGLISEASTFESPLEPETPTFGIRTSMARVANYDDENYHSDHHEGNEDTQGNDLLDELVEQRMSLIKPQEPAALRPEIIYSASETLPGQYSSGRKDSQFHSLSSGLSDLASFVKYVDEHMQTLDPANVEQYGTTVSEPRFGTDTEHVQHCNQTVKEAPAPPRSSSLQHHTNNYVGCKINRSAPIDELERFQVVSTRSGPTLVPQPISPARMLRVQNSIPQLMKALPPLPGYSPASQSPFNPTIVPVEFEPFEFSRLTDARSTLIEPFGSESHRKRTPEGHDPFSFDRGVRKPKLKLKNPTPLASGNFRRMRPVNFAQADVAQSATSDGSPLMTTGEYSTAPVKRRLTIKISRPMLGSLASEYSGTVKRRHGVDRSTTISELATSQPLDLFSTSKVLKMAVLRADPCLSEPSSARDKKHGTVLMVDAPPVTSKQSVTTVDEGRGVSLDTHLRALQTPRAKSEVILEDEMQSFFSDSLVRPRGRLRKQLSNLKSRLMVPRHQQMSCTTNDVVNEDNFNKVNPSIETRAANTSKNYLTDLSPTKDHRTTIPTRTVRSKLGKLVKGVKYRFRTWGKHKHKDSQVNVL